MNTDICYILLYLGDNMDEGCESFSSSKCLTSACPLAFA